MHADLAKLLDLQSKDTAVSTVEQRIGAVRAEVASLDAAVQHIRASVQATRHAVTEGSRQRGELETKIETLRATHTKRQQRLDQVKNPKEAAAATAELDLAATAVATEEAAWVRSAEVIEQQERKAQELEARLGAAETEQQPARERLADELRQLEAELASVLRDREVTAEQVNRPLRTRYDRLRRARATAVVVPLVGNTCGACFTMVPLNRRTLIRAGQAIDDCQACGVILYPPDRE